MSAATQAVKLDWETQDFRAALETYMKDSKRDISVVMRQQMKSIVRRLVASMPPHKGKGEDEKDIKPKKMGEMAILGDVGHIVKIVSERTMDDPLADSDYEFSHKGQKSLGTIKTRALRSVAAIKQWHYARRTPSTGRVPKLETATTTGYRKRDLKYLDKGLTTEKLFNAYLKEAYKHVGALKAGWKAAARKMGLTLPKWIDRHSVPSYATITENWRGITIVATNALPWASANRTESHVRWAVNSQRHALEKQIENRLKNQANKFRKK